MWPRSPALRPVFVGAGQQHYVVAAHTLVARNRIGDDGRIGVAEVRARIDVIDRRGQIELWFQLGPTPALFRSSALFLEFKGSFGQYPLKRHGSPANLALGHSFHEVPVEARDVHADHPSRALTNAFLIERSPTRPATSRRCCRRSGRSNQFSCDSGDTSLADRCCQIWRQNVRITANRAAPRAGEPFLTARDDKAGQIGDQSCKFQRTVSHRALFGRTQRFW